MTSGTAFSAALGLEKSEKDVQTTPVVRTIGQ
jgi:hypothetical protein